MKTTLISCLVVLLLAGAAPAREYFVSPAGSDSNSGTRKAPLRRIQRAAELALPGDIITVRAGVYRERINPPRGGESDRKRIVYRGAPGERVEIKGSEVVKTWEKIQPGVWKAVLPNSYFGEFNPYREVIHGDWFEPKGREHHVGAVYLNGDWLIEASRLEEVLAPPGTRPAWLPAGQDAGMFWYARVEGAKTTIWAQFKGVNPNEQLVEINVRRTVFYPDHPGRNYITVRNFILSQAATSWAPPTAEQVGLIGTHWSQGWIIEDNTISYSICSGVALGKYGDQWDNTSANTAEGYVKTIERALQNGWNRETIGHHVVRNNTISHCEQTGIVGSLGAAFSTISGNTIHDIHVRRLFSGAEMAGIKFHAAIDTVINHNHIYRTCRGLWLDWMAQGTRVSSNLFHDNTDQDVFVEVDHGPFLVDNNLFLSAVSLLDMSEGGAYAHNLFAGKIVSRPEPSRQTPYHPAHSTRVAGLEPITGGDDRFYNNVFIGQGRSVAVGGTKLADAEAAPKDPEWKGGFGLWVYNWREFPLKTGGNVYYNGACPYGLEFLPEVQGFFDPQLRLLQERAQTRLLLTLGPGVRRAKTGPVTTASLGLTRIAQLRYENATGTSLKIDCDFFGKRRDRFHPTPGPFEKAGEGELTISCCKSDPGR